MQRVEVLSDDEEEPVKVPSPPPKSEAPEVKVSDPPALVNSWDSDRVKEALARANEAKSRGNTLFQAQDYEGALEVYNQCLDICSGCEAERDVSIFLGNKSACLFFLHRYGESIEACDAALKVDPNYVKVILRRAQAKEALDEGTKKTQKDEESVASNEDVVSGGEGGKKKTPSSSSSSSWGGGHLEEALKDYRRVLELDNGSTVASATAREGVRRLEPVVRERQEKAKNEMLDQLKGLGNTILGKFGLSLDNFNLQQDPSTGSYSVQFNQGK